MFGRFPVLKLAMATAAPAVQGAALDPKHGVGQIFFSQGGDDPIIEVDRRRKDDSSGPRERADAPQRHRTDGGGQPSGDSSGSSGGWGAPPSGGGGGGGWTPPPTGTGSTGGGGSTGGMSMVGIIVLLVILAAGYFLFGGSSTPTPTDNGLPTATPVVSGAATAVPGPTKAIAVSGTAIKGQKWLVMLYQDADDPALEQDIFVDMNEAERAGSDQNVQIVSQLDRYKGAFTGDGNWTGARRYLVTKDDDLSRIGSQLLQDLGVVDSSDPNTLVDFATWAMKTYPADKYALILSDHGMGWPGGMTDPAGDGRSVPDAPLAQAVGSQMFLSDIDGALAKIRANTGLDKFEFVGLDACLMSSIEVLDALAPSARYAVTSEETEPSLGWAYTSFLDSLKQNPAMSGGDLAQKVVSSYIVDDQRILDDSARNAFSGSRASASQVSQQLTRDVTLTAVDLGGMPTLMNAVNGLAFSLQSANQQPVAQARQYTQAYTNVFDENLPSPYIDLGNFVQLLQQYKPSGDIATALTKVQSAMQGVVLAEKHGTDKPGATGVSIYFPNSTLYKSPVSGPQSYTKIANRFATESVWDNFLDFHYTGSKFTQAPEVVGLPSRTDTITSPAAGGLQVSALRASGQEVAPGQSLTLSADVTGKNVGYIKFFTGYYDKAANSINIVDTDYLESPNTQQLNGLYYPVWGDGSKFTVQFKWEPIVFGINDGTKTVQALLTPQTYGAQASDAVYTVDGMYTFASSGETRYARLYFRDGNLQQVLGYTGQDGTGAARALTPEKGDKFTINQKWMDLDANGQATGIADQAGDALTFGDTPFVWKSLDAAAGDYVVGFIVEDIDGNQFPTYTDVTVK